jgi:hypothetical protein
LLIQQVKFKNWYMLVLSQYHKFESYKINIYSVLLLLFFQTNIDRSQQAVSATIIQNTAFGNLSGSKTLLFLVVLSLSLLERETSKSWEFSSHNHFPVCRQKNDF